jgi:hypothetical protein
MSPIIQPPNSILLLVGREEFTPPDTFAGRTCVATDDCVAVGVRSGADGPTSVTLSPAADTARLSLIGDFTIESEGLVSLRDVYSREYDAMGVEVGRVRVAVWADDVSEPGDVTFLVGDV